MRALLRPLILPFLRRDEAEIARQAERFRIETDAGKALIAKLGQAFIGGYNAMLESESPAQVAERGMQVPSHFRPFFFEGAAMGYLPRDLSDYSTSCHDSLAALSLVAQGLGGCSQS